MPEVIEAWLVTGEYDYILKAAVGGTAGYVFAVHLLFFNLHLIKDFLTIALLLSAIVYHEQ